MKKTMDKILKKLTSIEDRLSNIAINCSFVSFSSLSVKVFIDYFSPIYLS